MVQGYCLKEKKKAEIKDAVFELNKAGRPVAHGKCSSCGGKIYKILAADEVPAALKEKAAKFKKGGAGSRKSRKSHSSRKSPARKSRKSKGSRKSRKSRK